MRLTRGNKFGARARWLGKERFDSTAESGRFLELKALERGGVVTELKRQVSFPLVVNGEKAAIYRADFIYRVQGTDRLVVEDVKGHQTPLSKLKIRLFQILYPEHAFFLNEVSAARKRHA